MIWTLEHAKVQQMDTINDAPGAEVAPRKGDLVGKFLNCEPPGLRKEANDKFES